MSYCDFVPVDSTLRTVVSPDSRKKFENVFLLEPAFKLKTNLHISSGLKKVIKKEKGLEILLLHYRDSKGKAVIPGSSFKGAISRNFLALCGSAEMTSNLFGATRTKAVISKVFFSDLLPEKLELREVEVLRQWRPQKGRRGQIKFYTRRAPPTNRYGFVECIPAGTPLKGKVVGYNLKPIELGGLIMAMGFGIENAVLKLGYAKPQGFGQMFPVEIKLYELSFDGLELKKRELNAKDFIGEFSKKFSDRIAKFSKVIFAGV
ncbi:MAG: RAMP superfamily CRISPR-associated protein [Archaeoglobaceae archaeon]